MHVTDLIAYVDVDDTLVGSVGATRIPMTAVVAYVRALHAAGATLYCWSAGGAEYARRSAHELGFGHAFAGFLPKPHVLLDDQSPAEWPHCLVVHPLASRARPWRRISRRSSSVRGARRPDSARPGAAQQRKCLLSLSPWPW